MWGECQVSMQIFDIIGMLKEALNTRLCEFSGASPERVEKVFYKSSIGPN